MKAIAFIDASNLFYGGEKSLGWKIDYEKLLKYLREKYKIDKAYYFGGVEIHKFQFDYRNGIRWYHWDPTKWTIFVLSKLRLAWDLRKVDEEIILHKRMLMTEKRLAKKLAGQSESFAQWANKSLLRLKVRLEDAINTLKKLNKERENLELLD